MRAGRGSMRARKVNPLLSSRAGAVAEIAASRLNVSRLYPSSSTLTAMLLLVALVLLVVLPSPWNVIAFAVSLVLFLVELLVWNRTVRHRRSVSGAQTLLGQTATVVSACRPSGQVRISGETWAARCEERADVGDSVLVTAVDGLTLVVERYAPVHARPT